MVRQSLGFAAWVMMAAAAFGCSSEPNMNPGGMGYPGDAPAEATAQCASILEKVPAMCKTDATTTQCTDCRTKCGKECIQLEGCPEEFSCPIF
jgi:hypothetical protein